jgi:hypothetical protein
MGAAWRAGGQQPRTRATRAHTRNRARPTRGQRPHRLVVRTSRCGRDNPGSTPGVVIAEELAFARAALLAPSMSTRPRPRPERRPRQRPSADRAPNARRRSSVWPCARAWPRWHAGAAPLARRRGAAGTRARRRWHAGHGPRWQARAAPARSRGGARAAPLARVRGPARWHASAAPLVRERGASPPHGTQRCAAMLGPRSATTDPARPLSEPARSYRASPRRAARPAQKSSPERSRAGPPMGAAQRRHSPSGADIGARLQLSGVAEAGSEAITETEPRERQG